MSTREILSYLVALLPAVYVGWWGRYLVRHLDDPLFPELHFKKMRRLGVAIGVGIGFSLALSNQHSIEKLLLTVFAVVAADFPARKRIFQETWGLAAYLVHSVRSWLALFGGLTLLAFLPEIVYYSGDAAPAVAVALGAVIVLWNHFNARIFPVILGASPFRAPELEARFAEVLAKARCRAPKLFRYGPSGGTFVNAFALPSLYRSGVVFSNSLLEALGPRETTAVFAHELGHLEHYHRWRLLGRQAALWILVAIVLALLLYSGPASDVSRTLTWAWPLGCMVILARSLARNQAHEHASDLRALELCGDARALVDALTKIHLLTRMPRRWAAASERRMSHPSLAQRLRAIREAAGEEAAVVDEPGLAVRAADDPSRAVVLTPDRLCWLAGLPAGAELDPATAWQAAGEARVVLYSDLADLRIEAGGFGGRTLQARERGGRTMKLALRSEDVAAVKAAIDRVDRHVLGTAPRLAPEVAATAGLVWTRLLAALATLFALYPPFTGPLALATLLVVIRPARATLAAAGAIGVASAVLGWWSPAGSWLLSDEGTLAMLALQGLFGVYFLGQAFLRYRRRYPDPRWTLWMTSAVLGGFLAFSAVGVMLHLTQPYPLLQLHLWARRGPALVLFALGIAAALATVRRLAARLPALGLAAVTALLVASGSSVFRERFGGDPLRTREPRLIVESGTVEKVREVPLEGAAVKLVLSPSGERLAFATYADDEDYEGDVSFRFVVEGPEGRVADLAGTALEFVDDGRVVLLASKKRSLSLSLVHLAPSSPSDPADAFEIALPWLFQPKLRLDGESWELLGLDEAGESSIRLSGRIGEPGFRRDVRGRASTSDGLYLRSLHVDAADRVLALGNRYQREGLSPFLYLMSGWGYAGTTEILMLEPSGARLLATTTLQLQCLDPEAGQRGFYCLTSDQESTQLWSVDPEDGFTPLGSLAGHYWIGHAVGDGRLLLRGPGDPLALVDPATSRAAKIGDQIDVGSPFGAEGEEDPLLQFMARRFGGLADYQVLAVRRGYLAVADGEANRVDVYRLPQ